MAIQEGAKYLETAQGGHGVLLGGVPGVEPATVLIIGGGVGRPQCRQNGLRPGCQCPCLGHRPGSIALSKRCHAKQLFYVHVPTRQPFGIC